ncbi:predicted transcription regulator, Lrp/AsnC family [Thermococcus kodakarensis KOD1]|uniref:Predicted transcription regulator, Lrp/AsnC family n=1 Tax=Thermococcus kodakarensis (strain ATCC BAA-918 / JCM 12380 / KOD1) TaxID=69014 RepID=Q5JDN7_THEKO|nr:Lrp/AsnC family transcriptional regulator [Thermococcus kodakarensis]WCN27841.1 Lrp/AsnC family transcriptional regulator [Thermococcus kodakarensis]WCN30139.1 Lrp/AsnC family transcriptional regulator [Thermococcus kodakarensis]BAD86144.1 predicted transcription regulator, Lrp/AsnC family [Thermococcus kodakarensis KOD1]
MNEGGTLTPRQLKLLKKLYQDGRTIEVHTVEKTQDELSKELGITRQALSNHLKVLKELGYIRTGRGFIDLTDKALELLGEKKGDVFVFVKIEPTKRKQVYEAIRKLNLKKIYRVTGDIDLIIEADKGRLDEILEEIASLDGVKETNTHLVLETL